MEKGVENSELKQEIIGLKNENKLQEEKQKNEINRLKDENEGLLALLFMIKTNFSMDESFLSKLIKSVLSKDESLIVKLK